MRPLQNYLLIDFFKLININLNCSDLVLKIVLKPKTVPFFLIFQANFFLAVNIPFNRIADYIITCLITYEIYFGLNLITE